VDGEFQLPEDSSRQAREAFVAWYKKQAEALLSRRLEHFGRLHGFAYSGFRISGAQRSLGSCNSADVISLSWRLVMAPMQVIDYVVVHELCHLRERNHSRRFWDKVKQIFPGWKEPKKWLKENNYLLRL